MTGKTSICLYCMIQWLSMPAIIMLQILSTSSNGKSAYIGKDSTRLLTFRATGVLSMSYFPWKADSEFVRG